MAHYEMVLDRNKQDSRTTAAGLLGEQLVVAQAAVLAREACYAQAENLLAAQLVQRESVAILDLLARIYAQQGRYAEAETAWRRALQLYPASSHYRAGLARIAQLRQQRFSPGPVLSSTQQWLILTLTLLIVSALLLGQMISVQRSVEYALRSPYGTQVLPSPDPNTTD